VSYDTIRQAMAAEDVSSELEAVKAENARLRAVCWGLEQGNERLKEKLATMNTSLCHASLS
jgi:hypothetical protein